MNQDQIEYERRRRMIRAKARRRKKRRQLVFFVLLILIVGTVALKGVRRLAAKLTTNLAYATDAEWNYQANLSQRSKKNKLPFTEAEELVNQPTEKILGAINVSLVKGSNHITSAEEYAFDTKEVREYILGTKKYKGEGKWAFLTFDDGPNTSTTLDILDTLKKKDAYATFFVVGNSVSERHSDVLRRQVQEGHALALHSYSHNYKFMYPGRSGNAANIVSEAEKGQKALQSILGKDFYTGVWRYPGGHMSWKNLETADQKLANLGIEWIDWNSLSGDAEPRSVRPTTAQGLVDFTNKTLKQNTNQDIVVVLMHDAADKKLTAQALPDIIDSLRDQGYSFGILK